jgi:hypothetical protein
MFSGVASLIFGFCCFGCLAAVVQQYMPWQHANMLGLDLSFALREKGLVPFCARVTLTNQKCNKFSLKASVI